MKPSENDYPYEIERKFLVSSAKWFKIDKPEGEKYIQGYITNKSGKSVRIRISPDSAFITIKGKRNGSARPEFEYSIPINEAEMMLKLFTKRQIEKIRYCVYHKGKLWEVDEFLGDNKGLVIAEIELESKDEAFEIPDWVGTEVTEDKHYYNGHLIKKPFNTWKEK